MKVRRQRYQEIQDVADSWKDSAVRVRLSLALACCGVLLLLSQAARAQEASLEVLHMFNPLPGGAYPQAALVQGTDGSFCPGGPRLPGDCNADGVLDISDAVCLLGFLFLGAPQSLPCGSGLPDDDSNLQLLDHNGDQRIDLSDPVALLGFLFLGGPPPRSGLDCVEIPGCSPACPP